MGHLGGNSKSKIKKKYRSNLNKKIYNELNQEAFSIRSKDGSQGAFTRDRKLTFKRLICLILFFKTSIQRDIDRFYKSILKEENNIREVTKGALTQARAKLNPWAFKRLNEVAVEAFYAEAPLHLWNGMRLLAIDGSTAVLPNHKSIKEEYGEHGFGPNADSKRSLATISMLYDVLNLITIDGQIDKYETGERELLEKHLEFIKKGDLLLLDRGYPSILLFCLLEAKGIEFCIRMKDNWWNSVNEFSQSKDNERIVEFKLPKKDFARLEGHPEKINETIKCRLIKVELENGEVEILCTSLKDLESYPVECFKALYHFRWNEEEAYKLLKTRIDLEDFSGMTARAVQQDFYAKIFILTLTSAYAHPIEERVRREFKADKKRKFNQKINRTNAISNIIDIIIPNFIKNNFENAIAFFDDIVYKTREIIRPGRNIPKKKRPRKPFSINYKKL